jgi:transposase InsO family protein
VTEMLRPSGVAAGFVADMFRTRDELLAENAALRQQLIVASRKIKKPEFRGQERGLLFDRVVKGAGIRVLKTAVRAPLMYATCERFLGSVRRECLDHVIILGQRHLQSVLREYVACFNTSRPHQGIQQTVPAPAPEETLGPAGNVVALPVLNGLHHDYRRAD